MKYILKYANNRDINRIKQNIVEIRNRAHITINGFLLLVIQNSRIAYVLFDRIILSFNLDTVIFVLNGKYKLK